MDWTDYRMAEAASYIPPVNYSDFLTTAYSMLAKRLQNIITQY